jgi:hypothetical protein
MFVTKILRDEGASKEKREEPKLLPFWFTAKQF